ncbi:MAG: metallophosphoesterase [Moheibacter sp.]
MKRLIVLIIIGLIAEWYSFQAVKTSFENKWIQRIYLALSVLAILLLVYSFLQFDLRHGQTKQTLYTLGLFLLIYIPKFLIAFFLFGEDIFRLIIGTYQNFTHSESYTKFLPERRKFISQVALAVAAIPFTSIIYGIFQGRYNFRVIKQSIYFKDLPDEFDGFTIMQLSDIHSGSFDNPEKIQYGIDLINEQQFDLFVFTGDIVNTFSNEMNDWVGPFSQIKTPEFGKYSILGNHDYGEYVDWTSEEEKEKNFEEIKAIHPKIGWNLMLNENVTLKKGNAILKLIGVENWGQNFKQAGDLKSASEGIKKEDFKILLSHDPSHWDLQVREHPLNYQLTLSGHTHGMQFGIEIPGFVKWSPVQYVYKHWAGLYKELNHYIYVNRGFGYHGYPGRVGIWPEITLLELKKDTNT